MAEAWDCAGDFFKLRWWVFERIPTSEDRFLSGYQGTSTLPVDLERRVAVVELIELVNVVANVVASDAAMADAAARRLERRLDTVR